MDGTIITLLGFMSGVKIPQMKFMLSLLVSLSCFVGKANFRNLSRHSQMCEHTYSRWFHRGFDYVTFNRLLLEHELPSSCSRIGAIDATFLNKSGKCTEHLGQFWNGSVGKAQKGLEISTVAIVDVQSYTAYGLDSRLTKGEKDAKSRTKQYSQQIENLKEHF